MDFSTPHQRSAIRGAHAGLSKRRVLWPTEQLLAENCRITGKMLARAASALRQCVSVQARPHLPRLALAAAAHCYSKGAPRLWPLSGVLLLTRRSRRRLVPGPGFCRGAAHNAVIDVCLASDVDSMPVIVGRCRRLRSPTGSRTRCVCAVHVRCSAWRWRVRASLCLALSCSERGFCYWRSDGAGARRRLCRGWQAAARRRSWLGWCCVGVRRRGCTWLLQDDEGRQGRLTGGLSRYA